MNLSRLIAAILVSVVVTAGLVVVMFKLVDREFKDLGEKEKYKFSEFNKPPDDIQTLYDAAKPDKPETPERPPDVPEPDFDAPETDVQSVNIGQPQVDTSVNVTIGGFKSDGEYLPIVRVEPTYPTRAMQREIEGWVIVEFTVTANGSVRDPVAIEGEPEGMFDREAERAVLKWKYKPRVIDGEPVEVPGVRTQLTFKLDK